MRRFSVLVLERAISGAAGWLMRRYGSRKSTWCTSPVTLRECLECRAGTRRRRPTSSAGHGTPERRVDSLQRRM